MRIPAYDWINYEMCIAVSFLCNQKQMSKKKLHSNATFPGLAERIKSVRGKLTQEELGELLGVTKATVCRYESGATIPPESTLKRIADFCNRPLEWVLRGESALTQAPQLPESMPLESPRSGPVLHSPFLFAGVDIHAMTQIIEMVEDVLSQRKKPLKPVKKALLISLLYDQFQSTGQPIDQATLKEFLRRVD
jgi:transcriptional regulator with XRE-family HTH domain